jgi:hypothetical protein
MVTDSGSSLQQLDELVSKAARKEAERVERAIRGAIRAGYDGVDVNRTPPLEGGIGIQEIVPWSYPAPDGANGYRTERYTWDYFSDEELTEILTDEDVYRKLANE